MKQQILVKVGKILMCASLYASSWIVFAAGDAKPPTAGAGTAPHVESKDKPARSSPNANIRRHREENKKIKKEAHELKEEKRSKGQGKNTDKSHEATQPHSTPGKPTTTAPRTSQVNKK